MYSLNPQGVFVPDKPVVHRDGEYDSRVFDSIRDMQNRHFWYRGRHRFLLAAVRRELARMSPRNEDLSAVDLGGGCGGWIAYLHRGLPGRAAELALADSSLRALELARPIVGPGTPRYQVDLLRLGWQERWDIVFLLDVLEHIPDDSRVLDQITDALKPSGLLFVTAPAFGYFWSYHDERARHVRRYTKKDFTRLAKTSGLLLQHAWYFMFFLSPLVWFRRLSRRNVAALNREEILDLARRTNRVPAAPINALLSMLVRLETPLGLRVPFPWGTSILGVFQKPS